MYLYLYGYPSISISIVLVISRDTAEVGSRKPPRPPPAEKPTWTHPGESEDQKNERKLLDAPIREIVKSQ